MARPPKKTDEVKSVKKSARITQAENDTINKSFGSWAEAIEYLIGQSEVINSHQERLKLSPANHSEGEE